MVHYILIEPQNSAAFFEGNVESKCHLRRGKGQMQSACEVLGYVARSDQGEAGLGIQLVLEMAPGSPAPSPRFWTTIILSVLISLGRCFPKQISSFSLHKWHTSGCHVPLRLPSKFSSSLQRLHLNPKHLSNQRRRWFLELVVSLGWGRKFWEEAVGPWVQMVLLSAEVHNENNELGFTQTAAVVFISWSAVGYKTWGSFKIRRKRKKNPKTRKENPIQQLHCLYILSLIWLDCVP